MNIIGFELEFLSLLNEDEIENDLHKMFGKRLSQKIEITTDCSIKRDKFTRVEDSWNAWEIITPPLPQNKAIDVLNKFQDYMMSTMTVTNKSCGFHVNVSAPSMKKFDSATLISVVDEFKFAKTYNREDNPYCVPWSYYFEQIAKRILRDRKLALDKKRTFKYNALSLIKAASNGEYVDDDHELKYATNVSKFFDEKYLTTNVSKLITHLPYVEFRMLGGKNYHQTMLSPLVKELSECVSFAATGHNAVAVNKYFNQYI